MAMPRKLPVEFGVAFPYGAYAVGEVQPVRDYDRSTKDKPVQAVDPDTGLLLWQVEVVDGDPDARKSNRTMAVKITAKVQPVLPDYVAACHENPMSHSAGYTNASGCSGRCSRGCTAPSATTSPRHSRASSWAPCPPHPRRRPDAPRPGCCRSITRAPS